MKRNGLIEAYRFLFACVIVIFHGAWIGGGNRFAAFGGGYLGVEFFFILSGYFLMRQLDRTPDAFSWRELSTSIAKRYKKLLPYMLPTFLILFIVAHISNVDTGRIILDIGKALYEVLLLCMLGTIEACPLYNPPIWYCSALLICIAVFYLLATNYRHVFTRVICPLGAVCIYGYLVLNYGSLNTITDKAGIFYTGLLRGFAAMAIGVILYEFTTVAKNSGNSEKLAGPLVASILLLAFVLAVCWISSIFDFIAVLALAVLVYIAVTSPRLADKFSSAFFIFLGRLSLPLYITQWIVVKGLSFASGLKADMGTLLFMLLYLGLCLGTAFVFELVVQLIKHLRQRHWSASDIT